MKKIIVIGAMCLTIGVSSLSANNSYVYNLERAVLKAIDKIEELELTTKELKKELEVSKAERKKLQNDIVSISHQVDKGIPQMKSHILDSKMSDEEREKLEAFIAN